MFAKMAQIAKEEARQALSEQEKGGENEQLLSGLG
jgi:hypothetical protein